MNTLRKVLFYAAITVIASFALTAVTPTAHAQGGGTYCASNDNRYARCQVSWRDAILVQQSSKAACIRGQTWGFDRNGIWVNGGCRGQFAPARGGWGGGGRQPQQMRCESSGNNYRLCPVNIQRGDDVRITNQLSSASCQQGRTWGVQPNGIWVNRGCRANFIINRRY
jgi:hypothetical protein